MKTWELLLLFVVVVIPVLLARAHFVQRKATFEYYSKEILFFCSFLYFIYLYLFVVVVVFLVPFWRELKEENKNNNKKKNRRTEQKLSALFCHFIFPMPQTIRPHLFISGIFNFNCQFFIFRWSLFFLGSGLFIFVVLKEYFSLFE